MPGRSTNLGNGRARAYCACSRCGWGLFGYFYAPPQKVAGYYVIPSELLSVRLSVRPSAVEHSCPVHNFDTVRDNFTKLGTNVKHDQTTCRD